MKIYTKTGDDGTTGLFGGKRVSKDDLRIEAYGTVDELNSFVGGLADHDGDNELLTSVQHRLFTIGSSLAADPDKQLITPDILPADIEALEAAMDQMNEGLPELRHFVLPGGHPAVSAAHVCRTVCRRAERRCISLNRESPLDLLIVQYLNRLSDYFFVLSRHLAHSHGADEVKWYSR
jgi:cob(I)alamin adenosyltransferase